MLSNKPGQKQYLILVDGKIVEESDYPYYYYIFNQDDDSRSEYDLIIAESAAEGILKTMDQDLEDEL